MNFTTSNPLRSSPESKIWGLKNQAKTWKRVKNRKNLNSQGVKTCKLLFKYSLHTVVPFEISLSTILDLKNFTYQSWPKKVGETVWVGQIIQHWYKRIRSHQYGMASSHENVDLQGGHEGFGSSKPDHWGFCWLFAGLPSNENRDD